MRLIEDGILTEDSIEEIREEVGKQVKEAVEFAIASPYPSNEELEKFVF